ncbi:hypothetical protein [Aquibacillus saliphilus]|uniref:hypothetical protein n=1 Tax=Aquibacillus saliphilus TaxID=1909422 RepID=UPI001CF09C6F|nr:hypothetical protein [Aquibacillus saliphilus]
MFQLQDRATDEMIIIYSVRSEGNKTEFLIYAGSNYGFVWNDSSYFKPRIN